MIDKIIDEEKIVRPTDIKQWYPFEVPKESVFKDVRTDSQPSGKTLPSLDKTKKN